MRLTCMFVNPYTTGRCCGLPPVDGDRGTLGQGAVVSSSVIVTLSVLAAVLEVGGISLAAVEVRRVINKTEARLGQSNPWDDHGQGAYDDIKGVSGLRLTAVAALLLGVVLATVANIGSATAAS